MELNGRGVSTPLAVALMVAVLLLGVIAAGVYLLDFSPGSEKAPTVSFDRAPTDTGYRIAHRGGGGVQTDSLRLQLQRDGVTRTLPPDEAESIGCVRDVSVPETLTSGTGIDLDLEAGCRPIETTLRWEGEKRSAILYDSTDSEGGSSATEAGSGSNTGGGATDGPNETVLSVDTGSSGSSLLSAADRGTARSVATPLTTAKFVVLVDGQRRSTVVTDATDGQFTDADVSGADLYPGDSVDLSAGVDATFADGLQDGERVRFAVTNDTVATSESVRVLFFAAGNRQSVFSDARYLQGELTDVDTDFGVAVGPQLETATDRTTDLSAMAYGGNETITYEWNLTASGVAEATSRSTQASSRAANGERGPNSWPTLSNPS
ncbi:hypothetical protein BRD17_09920 [Halobacteriales archaeon SW_7_68_16]|nr:MAG: hypothetical protein BRD17_09920 [Halobacteriales archaeon SW_7_68_16]